MFQPVPSPFLDLSRSINVCPQQIDRLAFWNNPAAWTIHLFLVEQKTIFVVFVLVEPTPEGLQPEVSRPRRHHRVPWHFVYKERRVTQDNILYKYTSNQSIFSNLLFRDSANVCSTHDCARPAQRESAEPPPPPDLIDLLGFGESKQTWSL